MGMVESKIPMSEEGSGSNDQILLICYTQCLESYNHKGRLYSVFA